MNQRERELTDQKVFVDDLNQVRLVNPSLLDSSSKLAEEGKGFFSQFEKFMETVKEVREAMEKIGRTTDRERLRLLSLQNQLEEKGDATATEEETQQIQILISERQKELERLRVELQSLKAVERQQSEYLLMSKKI